MLATPLMTGAVPMGVVPSKKLTVPVGVGPAAAVVRVAVRTVGLSRKTGLTELVSEMLTTFRTVSRTVLEVRGLIAGVAGVDGDEGVDAGEWEAGDEGGDATGEVRGADGYAVALEGDGAGGCAGWWT